MALIDAGSTPASARLASNRATVGAIQLLGPKPVVEQHAMAGNVDQQAVLFHAHRAGGLARRRHCRIHLRRVRAAEDLRRDGQYEWPIRNDGRSSIADPKTMKHQGTCFHAPISKARPSPTRESRAIASVTRKPRIGLSAARVSR